jgi:hypothetical protein
MLIEYKLIIRNVKLLFKELSAIECNVKIIIRTGVRIKRAQVLREQPLYDSSR